MPARFSAEVIIQGLTLLGSSTPISACAATSLCPLEESDFEEFCLLILDEKFSGLNIHVGKGLLSPHLTFHCSFFRIVSTSPPRELPFLVFLVLALPYWYFTSFRDGKYWAWTSSQSGREPRVSARVHPTVMLLQVVHVLNAGNLTRNPSLIAEPQLT